MNTDVRLRSYIDRILRLKVEQDALAADIREVYAEAKADGFDKTVMGEVVAHLRRVDKRGAETVAERQTIFDSYLHAYYGAVQPPSHAHARARSDAPVTDLSEPIQVGCRLTNRPAAGMAGGVGDASSPPPPSDSPTVALSTGDPSGRLSVPSPDEVPTTDGVRASAETIGGQSGQESGPAAQDRNEPVSVDDPSAGDVAGERAASLSPADPSCQPSPSRATDIDLEIPTFLRRGHPDCRFTDTREGAR